MKSDDALEKLRKGNVRFISGDMSHPNQDPAHREALKKGQEPFAVILTCSDSRTAPEIIFDRGLGDLFIIRTAGNIADSVALGSIELAVEEFGVPVIMVLGHQNCGAIKLALEDKDYTGHLDSIMAQIKLAVKVARELPGNVQDNVAKANVKNVVTRLKEMSPLLANQVDRGDLKIVGGYYWFDDGRVEILD